MNRLIGAVVILIMLAALAIVASRAFEERNRRLTNGQPSKLLEAEQKKAGEVPLWRQR